MFVPVHSLVPQKILRVWFLVVNRAVCVLLCMIIPYILPMGSLNVYTTIYQVCYENVWHSIRVWLPLQYYSQTVSPLSLGWAFMRGLIWITNWTGCFTWAPNGLTCSPAFLQVRLCVCVWYVLCSAMGKGSVRRKRSLSGDRCWHVGVALYSVLQVIWFKQPSGRYS